jgi:hypothetical protein
MEYLQLSEAVIPALRERVSLLLELLREVGQIADRSQVADAQRVARLLSERVVLRIPWGDGQQIAYYRDLGSGEVNLQRVIFVALVKAIDTWRLKPHDVARQYVLSSAVAGAYYKSTRTIYLSAGGGFSLFWRAMVLLHEGVHALDHEAAHGKRVMSWRTEWHAQRCEYEVLSAIFDEPFRALLGSQDQDDAIRNLLNEGEHLRLWVPPTTSLTDDALDAVFGTAASREEARYRRTVFIRCFVQHALKDASTATRRRLAVT